MQTIRTIPGKGANPQLDYSNNTLANSQILGYLGRALSLEFSAAQHYLAQASQSKFRNEMNYAENFIELANEELQHANLLTDRMVAHGALPSGSVLRPASVSNNIIEALRGAADREVGLINLYNEATQYCANIGAQEDLALFSRLLDEEKAQLARVNAWIDEYVQMLTQTPNRSFV